MAMGKKTGGTGRKLLSALTQDQIEALLDTVGSRTLLERIEKNRNKAEPDFVDTVEAILKKKLKSLKRRRGGVASDSRLIENWNDLWSKWDDIIGDVGNEEGKYVIQEHHWEDPYFDGSAVAKDLEEIGAEMFKQIDEVYELVDEPGLFNQALDDIEQAIDSYPEWMGADCGDGCVLEQQTTLCVLTWLWLSSEKEAKPGGAFLKKVEDIESQYDAVGLDSDATVEFVTGLPDPVCLEIHEDLQNGRFEKEQENAYSKWNAITHEFERRYDRERYLERCGRNLEKNWHEGEPLIKKAVQEKDWERAESWLVKTLSAYRYWRTAPDWYPEQKLLIAGEHTWRDASETSGAARLLEQWSKVSEKLGNRERGIAARFQAVVVRIPDHMKKIIAAFNELKSENALDSLSGLFKQWQDEIAERSLPIYDNKRRFPDTWIHWAIAAYLEDNGRELFGNKIDTWLQSIMKNDGAFKQQWELLALLTGDLADAFGLRKSFPGLFKSVIERFGRKSVLDTERAEVLLSLCGPGLEKTVMEIWRRHFVHIMPDPATSSNDYLKPVAWVKALLELNPDDYFRVIKKWRNIHHRRRNLWKAIHDARLPGGEE